LKEVWIHLHDGPGIESVSVAAMPKRHTSSRRRSDKSSADSTLQS
jgi:hypothetical protein